jgi:hypothetical protein
MASSGSRAPAWWLWIWWVMANTIGVVFGYGTVLTIASDVAELGSRFAGMGLDGDRVVSMAIIAAVGIAITFAQWFVLKEHLYQAAWWALSTAVGWFVGAAVAMTVTDSAGRMVGTGTMQNAITFGSIGMALGIAQWLILRGQVPRAWWWVVASMVGWMGASLAIGEAITSGVQIAVVGAIPSAITGFALVWLFKQPPLGMPGLGRIAL